MEEEDFLATNQTMTKNMFAGRVEMTYDEWIDIKARI